ncbi:MAG TPA: type II toxin-antitoxin system VapC family toxin [Methylocystis sp.]|nr:type II toxin-antitoxin system VapC family toxin [Methylocystis sp.]
MIRVMLDTNVVSQLVKRNEIVRSHMRTKDVHACISVVTEGELLYGLARHPAARQLNALVSQMLQRLDVLAWTRETAQRYGTLRAELERNGKTLAPLDLMIAAHALEADAFLATSDRAFANVPGLKVADWSAP